MIRINLLPEEYRRKARTPLILMLAVSLLVAVNASLGAWLGWLAFGVAARVESERTVLQTENDGLKPQVAYHKSLDAESQRHKARETTLGQISTSRVSWTRKLDEFIDVVNRGGDGQRHLTWFDDLNVSQDEDARGTAGGSFKATGQSGSDDFGQVANFLDDLEASHFITDFRPPAPPEGSESQTDEELMPPVVWSFPLSVELKTPDERVSKAQEGQK